MLYRLTRLLILSFLFFLSGCSTSHPTNSQYPIRQLLTLKPQYAQVKNGQIEYYRFGSGTPIVLIAGYVTDVSSWNRQFLAALAEHHDVIVFNNRNVAGSVIHSNRYASQDLANDTYQLIQQLHLKKPTVLGISMGGMIAQQVAVLHQDKIGHLVLINTAIAGKQAVHPTPATEKLMLNMPTDKTGRYFVAVKLFFSHSDRLPMAFSLITNRFQPKQYSEINATAVIEQQRFLVNDWIADDATADKIAKLHIPTLILNGLSDDVIPPVNSNILARTIPHAKLKRWPYGGHAMIYQYPVEMAQVVDAFIENQTSL